MNRRQLTFVIAINALVSLAIVLLVTWIVEMRRPDPELLAAQYTPPAQAVVAPTATAAVDVLPTVVGPADPAVATVQAAVATGEQVVYVVQSGDSLLGIASRYGVTIDDIVQTNNLANPDFVFSGQRLIIPVSAADASAAETQAAAQAAAVPGEPAIQTVESPGTLASEAVLIVNQGDNPVNLRGWRLERENGPVYTFGDLQLFAGSSVRVYSSQGDDNTVALYWAQDAPVWTQGAVARLVDAAGAEVDRNEIP
jgi:LysM repeat protein